MTTIVNTRGEFRTPTGLRVKGQSYVSIEKVAETLRPSLPVMHREKYRLDCQAVFEARLPAAGFNYRVTSIEEASDCAGFTVPEKGIVALRVDVYDLLCADQVYGRSTVIHELSHIGLNHHATLRRSSVGQQHEFYEDSEWQAKALTAALMMSIEAAKAAKTPKELAEMCGTSVEAATYRISNLVKKLKLLTPSHSLWEYGMDQ